MGATQKDAAGKTTTYSYNTTKGTLSSVTDPMGNTTSYTYDADDDKLKSVTSGDSTINYEYADTTTDYLLEIRGETASYSFTYDEFGNTVSTNVGTQSLMTNTYEAGNGNLSESTYGNGDKITYVYDVFDRISEKKYNDVIKYHWDYNAKGAVGKHIDNENGKTYTYEYDLLGRIQRVSVSDGSFIESSYNNIDLSTGMTYGFGGTTKTVGYSYSDKDNMPESVTLPNSTAITNSYDKIGRVTSVNYGDAFSYEYTYQDVDSEKTTGLVSSMSSISSMPVQTYTYDDNGNIATLGYANYVGTSSSTQVYYYYDSLGQLVRTDSNLQNKPTWVYEYDDSGNILSKKRYAYTTGDLTGITPTETINYTYGNDNWGDLLTSYNGKPITYDAIGNPLTYDGWTYTWKDGRKLATASNGTNTLSYKYNADGIRTSKTVNGTTTEYFLNGTQIIAQKTGDSIMWFYYDHNGRRIGLEYQGAMYYYIYNLQGDVEAIVNSSGTICGSYEYNDWGKIIDISNIDSNTVANANPFRYRGYYYDTETELYYLNSRYYNPEWGRFINADGYVATGQGIIGNNMFVYCGNNPISREDSNGMFWKELKQTYDNFKAGVKSFCSNLVEDIKNFNVKNTDEKVVMESNYFSCYKGVLVVRLPGTDAGFSTGNAIFYGTENSVYKEKKQVNDIKHEYGHCQQRKQLGFTKFLGLVVIPSLMGYWGDVPYDEYYSQPWEYGADKLGGVDRDGYEYSDNAEEVYAAYWDYCTEYQAPPRLY